MKLPMDERYRIHRENCEEEARLDLTKNVQALLADIHDESNKGDLVHANKRIAGLNAVLAKQQLQAAERQYNASQDILTASNAVVKAVGDIHTLVGTIQGENKTTQRKIAWLNWWMMVLTVLGVLFGGAQCWSARESLDLQKASQTLPSPVLPTNNPIEQPASLSSQFSGIAPTILAPAYEPKTPTRRILVPAPQ